MEKKNPKSDLWNDVVKAVVERKEALWNILEAKDKEEHNEDGEMKYLVVGGEGVG